MGCAVYSTFVFRHKTDGDARRVFQAIRRRWPMLEDRRTVTSAWSAGDAMSVADAGRLALECRFMDSMEKHELALEVLKLNCWADCLAKFAEWELEIHDGELIDLRDNADADAMLAERSKA